jgi:hypothetical protein
MWQPKALHLERNAAEREKKVKEAEMYPVRGYIR